MPRCATLLTLTARSLLCACGLGFAVAVAIAQSPLPPDTRSADELAAAYAEAGRLPLAYISPNETGLTPSNWALTEDPDGLIYVGNSEGLLVYDGVRWRSVAALEGAFVRSLDAGPDGMLYVGMVGDFGRLRPGAGGALVYESLLALASDVPEGVTDVWMTETYAEGVAFYTETALFLWEGEAVTTIRLTPEPHVARVDDVGGVLVAVIDPGSADLYLAEVDPDAPVSQWERLPLVWDGSPPYGILARPNGGILIVTGESGLWHCAAGTPRCAQQQTSELAPLLAASHLYAVTQHPSGLIALGFDGGGIVLVAPDGRVLRHLTESAGLENGEVMGLMTDRSGTLWAALYNGVARLDVSARVTRFGKAEGIPSQVNTVTWHEGTLWATTMLGTRYHSPPDGAEGSGEGTRPLFVAPPDANRYVNCYDQVVLGEAHYLACSTGIAEADRDGLTLAVEPEPLGTFNGSLTASVHEPDLIYASRDKDVVALRLRGDALVLDQTLASARNVASRFVEEPERDAEGRIILWTYSPLEGLCRIAWLPGSDATASLPARVRCLADDALPSEIDDLAWLDGALRAFTRRGPYCLNQNGDEFAVIPDTALARLAPVSAPGIESVKDGPDGTRWVVTENAVTPWRQSDSGSYVAEPGGALRFSRASAPTDVAFDPAAEHVVWISTQAGLVRYHYEASGRVLAAPTRTLIRAVLSPDVDSVYFAGHLPTDNGSQALTLPFSERALRFQYAAPGLGGALGEGVVYRHRLLGDGDESWSAWTDDTEWTYTRLPARPYVFEVEATDHTGARATMGRFAFTIRQPWYRTTLWLIVWTALGLVLFFGLLEGINRIRTRRMVAHARDLAARIDARTDELNVANAELRASNLRLHELNQQLGIRTEDLQEALGRNEEILGIAAHDLRNPLTGIHGLAEALTEDAADDLDAEHADLLAVIRDEAKRTLGIIQNLLEKHQGEARTNPFAPLHRERSDLTEMMQHTLHWNRSKAEAKHITLRLETATSVWAEVDQAAMQRVLDNIVSNAVKYSPQGTTVRAYVETLGHSGGDSGGAPCARITIRDEGPGLTETDKRRAFQRGQRLSAKPTAGEASTGLGLYIVKRVIEGHSGKVGVDSIAGQGAAFWIAVPQNADERVPSGSFDGGFFEPQPPSAD